MEYFAQVSGKQTVIISDPAYPVRHTSDILIGIVGSLLVASIVTLTFAYFYTRKRHELQATAAHANTKRQLAKKTHAASRPVKK